MARIRVRLGTLVVAAVAAAVAACGKGDHVERANPDSGATLEGTVKVGNEEVQFAQITAKGAGGVATGSIGEDGKYTLKNVPVGEVLIGVNTAAAQGDYQSAVMAAGAMSGGPQGKSGRKKVDVKMVHLKDQYFDPDKSGLKTTVNKGPNTYNIELPASAKGR
jgi:hypothetical protein